MDNINIQKKIRWLAGLGVIAAVLVFIVAYPIPSLLKWQSPFLTHCFFILAFCFLLCMIRVVIGPTAADRAVAVDTLGILIVGFCAILSLPTGRDWYFDIAIAWALQSFIGALAIAKHLEGKGFDE